jgi:beta-fructofuranosidase
MLSKFLVAAVMLFHGASAQSSSSSGAASASSTSSTQAQVLLTTASAASHTESGVPTDTPVPGDYTGPLRPQVHFSPPQHFMNDPNGMFVDDNGTWHLYFQCE